MRETCAGSASLSCPSVPDPVARQSQEGWGCTRVQELPDSDKYAIQPPSGLHLGFAVRVYSLSLLLSQDVHKAVELFDPRLGFGGLGVGR